VAQSRVACPSDCTGLSLSSDPVQNYQLKIWIFTHSAEILGQRIGTKPDFNRQKITQTCVKTGHVTLLWVRFQLIIPVPVVDDYVSQAASPMYLENYVQLTWIYWWLYRDILWYRCSCLKSYFIFSFSWTYLLTYSLTHSLTHSLALRLSDSLGLLNYGAHSSLSTAFCRHLFLLHNILTCSRFSLILF
jgi:hypothetical protein